MMCVKLIVVVDDDIDVQNTSEVLFRMGNNVDWKRDTVIVEGPVDSLDHAAPLPNYGGKMGVDATTQDGGRGLYARVAGGHRDEPGDYGARDAPLARVFPSIGSTTTCGT